MKNKKGFISFIALILAMIVSAFIVNMMSLSNANTTGLYVKRSLDKANLAAVSCPRMGEFGNSEDADSYVLVDEAKDQFSFLLGKSFGLSGPINLNPIREYNGHNILFKYNGYETLTNNKTFLSQTPSVLFGIFNYEDLVGKEKAESSILSEEEKTNDYRLLIKAIIGDTTFVADSTQNTNIQHTLLKNLFPEEYNPNSTVLIKTTKPISMALAEIPLSHSSFNVKKIYRFSFGRLNVYTCEHIYVSDCASICYKCGKVRVPPIAHTRDFPCSQFCSVCKEKLSGSIPHESIYQSDKYPCNTTIRCKYCNSIMVGNTSHTLGLWQQYQTVSCDRNGTERAYCTKVGCTYFDERVSEYASGHNFVSATCSTPLHCSKCDYEVENSELPHTFGEIIINKQPTCYERGEKSRSCEVCGYKEIEYINTTNHKWGTPVIIKQATVNSNGIIEQTCNICHSIKQTEIPKLP